MIYSVHNTILSHFNVSQIAKENPDSLVCMHTRRAIINISPFYMNQLCVYIYACGYMKCVCVLHSLILTDVTALNEAAAAAAATRVYYSLGLFLLICNNIGWL